MMAKVNASKERTLEQLEYEDKIKNILCAITSILGFCLVWHFCTAKGTTLGKLLPGPLEVLKRLFLSIVTNIGLYTIQGHILWSLYRVMAGYLIAAAAGIVLGVGMGWNRMIEAMFRPIFEMIRPIPPVAWIPISIVWFGLGEAPKYFIIFLGAFTSLTMNAYAGAKSVDPVLVGAAKMLGANDRQIFFHIVLPSAVPNIFAGLQIALSSSWGVVLAAEMIRSSEGLGWVIIMGQNMNDLTQIIVGIVAVGVVGFAGAVIMRGVEAELCAWNQRGR